MISKNEILTVANETGLDPIVIEKDYLLGWLLAAVGQNPVFSQTWVFKGDTCLNKCYSETYRYSENLEVTLLEKSHIEEAVLIEQFTLMEEWLYDETGIEIATKRLKFDFFTNSRSRQSCQGRVYYRSYFFSGKRSWPRIKIDLTVDETLARPLTRQTVTHPYTDELPSDNSVVCYDHPEVLGEKIKRVW